MLTIIGYILCVCPVPELLKPCICNDNEISCGGNDLLNLKHMFQKIDQELDDNQKSFNKFYLNNTAIIELEENTFSEITFEEINITDAENLKLINTLAFSSNNMIIKRLVIKNCPIVYAPPNYDIFFSISLMLNIESVIIENTTLTKIPSNAFRPVNGVQNKLSQLYIHQSSSISEIGNYPFYYLSNLSDLSIEMTSIDFIPSNAFHFKKEFNQNITIWLDGLKLNSSSFALHSLDFLKRPAVLIFDGSQEMTYLNESIFAPFLEVNPQNIIDLRDDIPFNCDDCRSFWINKESKYIDRIKIIKCSNGNDIRNNSNFSNCK